MRKRAEMPYYRQQWFDAQRYWMPDMHGCFGSNVAIAIAIPAAIGDLVTEWPTYFKNTTDMNVGMFPLLLTVLNRD